MVENGFDLSQFWPPSISKSRQKRRKPFISETHALNRNERFKEIDVSKLVPSKYLGDNLVEGNPIPMVGIFVSPSQRV